jgi:hypothetical protein
MSRLLAVVLVAVLSVVLLAAGWWMGRQESTAGRGDLRDRDAMSAGATAIAEEDRIPASVEEVAKAPASTSAPAPVNSAASTPPLDPLPPQGTPVADMLEPLLERARRGDAGAACRLASELQRCRESAMRRGMRGFDLEARVAGETDERRRESMIQAMARMEAEQERADGVCADVTDEQIALAFPLQMQAAQARPELRTWLAINPALDTRFFLDNIENWQQYRQVAVPWMESAAAAGDLSALIALARVHGDSRSFGPPIPPFRELDDERFIAYATLLERYGMTIPPVQQAAEEARGRVEPDVIAAAEDRAESMFRPEAVLPESGEASRAMRGSFQRPPGAVDCD